MYKRYAWGLAKYGLALAALAFVLWQNWAPASGPGLKDALNRPFNAGAFALALLIYLLGALITFLRWFALVRAQDLPFTPGNAVRLGFIGLFLSMFLPTSIGGDIVKAAFIAREQSRRTVAVATVLIDRGVGLWGIIWTVAILGGAFWLRGDAAVVDAPKVQFLVKTAFVVVGVTLGLWGLLCVLPERRAHIFAGRLSRIPKLGHMATEFWWSIWMYRSKAVYMVIALLLSLLSQLCFVVAFHFSAHLFADPGRPDEIPSLAQDFLIVPVGVAVQALAPVPGGLGLSQLGYGALYELVGKPAANGVMASLAYQVIIWATGLIGYLVYLQMKPALKVEDNHRGTEDTEEAQRRTE